MFRQSAKVSAPSRVSPLGVSVFLGIIALLLVVMGTLTQVNLYLGHPGKLMEVIISRFDLNGEGNIPAWFSAMLLLVAGLILIGIGRQDDTGWRKHWLTLGVIFILLSLDENASLHERTIKPLRDHLHTHGLLYYAWLIPAIAFVGIVALSYLPFLLKLPRKTAILFIVSGAIFVSGAVGMEMISGIWVEKHDETNLTSAMLSVVEESLEMAGTILFIYATLAYTAKKNGRLEYLLQ